jgi:hypothetical protein
VIPKAPSTQRDPLTPAQASCVKNLVTDIVRERRRAGGDITYPMVWSRLKQKFGADHYTDIPRALFPTVLAYLIRFKYAVQRGESPEETRWRLTKQIHAFQRTLGWSDEEYRRRLRAWFGVASSTELTIAQKRQLVRRQREELEGPHGPEP